MHSIVIHKLREHGLKTQDLIASDLSGPAFLPTFLQSDSDVHGSHGLFYWLRCRGNGIVVANGGAATVLTWRPDVGLMAAMRPVGDLTQVISLLDAIASSVPLTVPFVARYCSADLAAELRSRNWKDPQRPWHPDAPADDETFPEVIVTAPITELPPGRRYKPIREAVYRHGGAYSYQASPSPLGMGEARFIECGAARAESYDEHENGFNDAVVSSLAAEHHDWLTYHYLANGSGLAGFAITANITGIAHGYYLSALDEPRLTAFFLWHIYLQQRHQGAYALNLGGSEQSSLYKFKTQTFPEHIVQRTQVLQSPATLDSDRLAP
jgi:hypothetical protein